MRLMKIQQAFSDRFLFEFIFEWKQLTPGWNWRTFHPIMIEFEDDRSLGGVETTIVILGVGFRFRYDYATTEMKEELNKRLEDFLSQNEVEINVAKD